MHSNLKKRIERFTRLKSDPEAFTEGISKRELKAFDLMEFNFPQTQNLKKRIESSSLFQAILYSLSPTESQKEN